jgi:hypothetical protein
MREEGSNIYVTNDTGSGKLIKGLAFFYEFLPIILVEKKRRKPEMKITRAEKNNNPLLQSFYTVCIITYLYISV